MDNPEAQVDNPQPNPQQADSEAEYSSAVRASRSRIDPETAMVLTRLYWQRRVEYQLSYYQSKAREFEHNVDLAFRAGAILMTFSSFLASVGIVVQNNQFSAFIALMTAIIPAVVSFIASFRQLYQWDRQLSLYRDTTVSLERAKLILPDLDSLTPDIAQRYYHDLVRETETVLEQEVAQWGQIALGKGEEDEDAKNRFVDDYASIITDKDGMVNQNLLTGVSPILDAGSQVPSGEQYAPKELDTNSILLPEDGSDEGRIARAAAAARAASQSDASEPIVPPALPDNTVSDETDSSTSDDPDTPDSIG